GARTILIHRKDGAFFVGVVRRLIEPIPPVIEHVVHEDAVGQLSFAIQNGYLAGVARRTLTSRVPLQIEFAQEEREGKGDGLRTKGDGILPSAVFEAGPSRLEPHDAYERCAYQVALIVEHP